MSVHSKSQATVESVEGWAFKVFIVVFSGKRASHMWWQGATKNLQHQFRRFSSKGWVFIEEFPQKAAYSVVSVSIHLCICLWNPPLTINNFHQFLFNFTLPCLFSRGARQCNHSGFFHFSTSNETFCIQCLLFTVDEDERQALLKPLFSVVSLHVENKSCFRTHLFTSPTRALPHPPEHPDTSPSLTRPTFGYDSECFHVQSLHTGKSQNTTITGCFLKSETRDSPCKVYFSLASVMQNQLITNTNVAQTCNFSF